MKRGASFGWRPASSLLPAHWLPVSRFARSLSGARRAWLFIYTSGDFLSQEKTYGENCSCGRVTRRYFGANVKYPSRINSLSRGRSTRTSIE